MMEVRFRPMSPSTIARQVKPGQASADDGQSFIEVVESLAGADEASGENADSGRDREQPSQHGSSSGGPAPSGDPDHAPARSEETSENSADPATEESTAASSDKAATEEKPIGARLDLTA